MLQDSTRRQGFILRKAILVKSSFRIRLLVVTWNLECLVDIGQAYLL